MKVPKGTRLLIPIAMLHRNEEDFAMLEAKAMLAFILRWLPEYVHAPVDSSDAAAPRKGLPVMLKLLDV
ncbi:unnamed protein product [Miscanthus lutarioriparius]|uniref:Uncharacterized protein n=1 Tax=Miscanthus lutarioriparius TaxID=422564 RepID=A0A811SPW1_9POAL|nr:unnamed protein product [Miscanthus lutarioriparius]